MIKVIVADDEEKVAQLICNLIPWHTLGMELAAVAHNGLDALDCIRKYSPDLIITDIRMPGCSGLELIEKAKSIAPELEFIIISGYRHFEYAQTAIKFGVSDYLLKPVKKDELVSTLEKMRRNYLHRTSQLSHQEQLHLHAQNDIRRLRLSFFSAIEENSDVLNWPLEKINRDYHYNMTPGLFEVLILKMDIDYDQLHNEGMEALIEKHSSVIRQYLNPVCCEMQVLSHKYSLEILTNYLPENEAEVRKALRCILDEAHVQNSVFPGAIFTFARGGAVKTVSDLYLSKQNARHTIAQRLISGAGSLLEKADNKNKPADKITILAAATKDMETALEVQDTKILKQVLDDFSATILAIKNLPGEDILVFAEEMFSSYLLLARGKGLLTLGYEDAHDEFCAKLDVCSSAQKVFLCLTKTVTEGFEGALQKKDDLNAKPIRMAKQYINANYMQQISLEQIAEQAGFNSSYYSTLFKKETGKTFSEYLAGVRISAAKELLRDTDTPIAKICEQVGYSDAKHFTSTFKKHTGIKPGEFRKLYS